MDDLNPLTPADFQTMGVASLSPLGGHVLRPDDIFVLHLDKPRSDEELGALRAKLSTDLPAGTKILFIPFGMTFSVISTDPRT